MGAGAVIASYPSPARLNPGWRHVDA